MKFGRRNSSGSPHRKVKFEWLFIARREPVALIEMGRMVVFGIHEDACIPNSLGCPAGSVDGVGQKQLAQSLTLHIGSSCQTAKTGHRNLPWVTFR